MSDESFWSLMKEKGEKHRFAIKPKKRKWQTTNLAI